MNSNEFWCRAFLTGMDNGVCLDGCVRAADAALEVAQRRGMVTVERAPVEGPALEPVEFTVRRDLSSDTWCIGVNDAGVFRVIPGEERRSIVSGSVVHTIRVQWGESNPPKPIKVWIERGGAR